MNALPDVPTDLPPTARTFDRDQAAAIIGISVRHLDQLFADGEGPRCVRIGRRRLYRLSDLDSYLADRTGRRRK